MADRIASLILAHNLYTVYNRGLKNDIVKACNSIGYPTEEAFIVHMNDFKQHNEFLYSELEKITSFFDTLANEAEELAQEFHNRRVAAGSSVVHPSEIVQIQERVKQELDRILETMMVIAEARERKNTAAREAEKPSTAGSNTASPTEGNTGVPPASGAGDLSSN